MAKTVNIRLRDGGTKVIENVSASRAIKIMCTECMGYETNPKECSSINCPLYAFRGKINVAFGDAEESEFSEEHE